MRSSSTPTNRTAEVSRAVGLLVALIGVTVALAGATSVDAASGGHRRPPCFGAASRDPVHPCRNPALEDDVIPTPQVAEITPSSSCSPTPSPIDLCTFGPSEASGRASILLVGDSHALHWRAALAVAARTAGWHGLSSTHDGCPFTLGVTVQAQPARSRCTAWNHAVVHWLATHRDIHTIVESNHPGIVRRRGGQSLLAAQVAGIQRVWRALPASVTRIVVIRDVPHVREDTLACLLRAIARHRDAGLDCAVARNMALETDPSVVAAARMRTARIRVVDLTHFFCDERFCYPVIGGSLVYKDTNHLTTVFSATIGPYLLAAIRRTLGQASPAGVAHT